ncbi:hypothetical protein D3C74_232620 [compost metagenome]
MLLRESFDIFLHRRLVADLPIHLGKEPIDIGQVLVFGAFDIVPHDTEDGSGNDRHFTVRPNFFPLRFTHQHLCHIPGQHLRLFLIAGKRSINDGLQQVIMVAFFGMAEVQRQYGIAQLFQENMAIVEQLCLRIADNHRLSSQPKQANGLQYDGAGLAAAGRADTKGMDIIADIIEALPVTFLP